ncbi:MAG: OsmC family protein [Bacteroidota bacterium]
MKLHHYKTKVEWTGNLGEGTSTYKAYSRNHVISADQKLMDIPTSSDSAFRGDPERYNPEELFLSSLSSCHMLWYLHLCTVNKIVVESYVDQAEGTMEESEGGSGRFTEVVLKPIVTIKDESLIDKAVALHEQANKMCFIANSCNFEIKHNPQTLSV